MIIIGYQGIGKSTLVRQNPGRKFIDLESTNFWVDGKRAENWYIVYCQLAMDLSSQGFIVFTSSHKEVRNWFIENGKGERIYTCSPDITLKEQWIAKLQQRYAVSKLEKDRKAMLNAEQCFIENVTDIQSDGEKMSGNIIIHQNYYDLKVLITSVY